MAIVVIVAFAAFIIYDITSGSLFTDKPVLVTGEGIVYPEPAWQRSQTIDFPEAKLWAVTVTGDDRLVAVGQNFLTLYGTDMSAEWTVDPGAEITALAVSGQTIYAATETTIKLFALGDGTSLTEWGPYEDKSLITSVSASDRYVVFADAGTRRVYILNTDGSMVSFFGHEGEEFIIPSGYFDLRLLPDNNILVVNPGRTRIEKRDIKGNIITLFGEPGIAPDAFSGCCNPSHFTILPDGNIATSEKGISRIKIMTPGGTLSEYVATPDMFTSALPFDLAADSKGRLFAASTYESKIFIFTRKE